ncbi:MAG TPA: hypothetical protein VGJ55_13150 [Pyrinomonadaceae bacterium]
MIRSEYIAPAGIRGVQQRALIAGFVFTLLLVVGAFINRDQFFHSYLIGFAFWIGVTLGALALLMLQHLTGGAWGLVIRRVLEAATRTIPLLLVLFVPIALGLSRLYPWMHTQEMAKSPALMSKSEHYLNPTFFIERAVIYFAIWSLLAYLLNRWSLDQDRTAERRFTRRMKMLSGPGLGLFVLTTTFASIDWVMSLDPEWSSTMFGLLFVASWALSAMAFVIATMSLLSSRAPLAAIVRASHFHDLGKLLLALVMLWSYFAFSQFLIIWSGNLPEETTWYLRRLRGGWGWIAIAVIVLHFALPFLLLLSRDLKRNAHKLAMLAGFLLVMRLVDLFWMIEPEFNRAHFHLSWMDVVAPLGIGGIWLAMFSWQLQQRPLVPLNDPQLETVLEEARKPAGAEAEGY